MAAALQPAIDERARIALRRLEWHMRGRRVESTLTGEHRSIFRGRGMEFDQVVPYQFGDDIRDVDWNVTARLGDVYRKMFVEDREIDILVMFADDPALQFGSGARTKRDMLAELAALVLLLGAVNRERVTLLHIRPESTRAYPPTRRREQIMAIAGALLSAKAPDPVGLRPPLSPLIRHPVARNSLIAWLGDVPDGTPPPEWRALCRRHQIIGIRIEDPWERSGPTMSDFSAYDPVAGEITWVRDTPATRAAHVAWRAKRERTWRAWWPDPADRLVVDADGDPLQALIRFLQERGRRGAAAPTRSHE